MESRLLSCALSGALRQCRSYSPILSPLKNMYLPVLSTCCIRLFFARSPIASKVATSVDPKTHGHHKTRVPSGGIQDSNHGVTKENGLAEVSTELAAMRKEILQLKSRCNEIEKLQGKLVHSAKWHRTILLKYTDILKELLEKNHSTGQDEKEIMQQKLKAHLEGLRRSGELMDQKLQKIHDTTEFIDDVFTMGGIAALGALLYLGYVYVQLD